MIQGSLPKSWFALVAEPCLQTVGFSSVKAKIDQPTTVWPLNADPPSRILKKSHLNLKAATFGSESAGGMDGHCMRSDRGFWSSPKRSPVIAIFKFVLLIAAVSWLLMSGTERLGYNWQWYRIPRYLFTFEDGHFTAGPLLQGLAVTLYVSGFSLVLCFVLDRKSVV